MSITVDHLTVTFAQPCELLSMNGHGMHWATKADLVATWRRAAWAAANNTRMRDLGPCYITVTLPVPDRRRRDPHNFFATVKPIIDGLVDAKFWPDDTRQWVTTVEPVLEVGASTVSIELRPR